MNWVPNTIVLISFSLFVAASGVEATAAENECPDLHGAFEQRAKLEHDNNTAELQKSDQRYWQLLSLSVGDVEKDKRDFAHSCCDVSSYDPIAKLYCFIDTFAWADQQNRIRSLRDIPDDPASLRNLWTIDEIFHQYADPSTPPSQSPVPHFLNEVFSLAGHGEKVALDRAMLIYESADDSHAEQLGNDWCDFFARNPKVIAKEWDSLCRHPKGLAGIRTWCSDKDNFDLIREQLVAPCKDNPHSSEAPSADLPVLAKF